MKNLSKLTLFVLCLLPLSGFAAKSPLCASSEVRLSLKPVFCIDDKIPGGLLDLPKIGLNLEDIQAIFDGAESSGGHGVISPMSRPQTMRVRPLPLEGQVECSASLLTDGGKRVSFLSDSNFTFSTRTPSYLVTSMAWEHSLVDQDDNRISIDVAPSVGVTNYLVNLKMEKNDVVLSVCEGKGHVATCSEAVMPKDELSASVRVVKFSDKPYVRRVLDLNCQIH